MYFYLVFAVTLAIVPGLAPLLCGLAVTAIALLIDLSGSRHPGVTFYARPIVFEFVYGISATACSRCSNVTRSISSSRLAGRYQRCSMRVM